MHILTLHSAQTVPAYAPAGDPAGCTHFGCNFPFVGLVQWNLPGIVLFIFSMHTVDKLIILLLRWLPVINKLEYECITILSWLVGYSCVELVKVTMVPTGVRHIEGKI